MLRRIQIEMESIEYKPLRYIAWAISTRRHRHRLWYTNVFIIHATCKSNTDTCWHPFFGKIIHQAISYRPTDRSCEDKKEKQKKERNVSDTYRHLTGFHSISFGIQASESMHLWAQATSANKQTIGVCLHWKGSE